MELWLNITGLIFNIIGAFLLYYFGAPPLRVTETGEAIISWINTSNTTDRGRNKQRYASFRRRARGGLLLIAFGFLLQLTGTVWPRLTAKGLPASEAPSMQITPELMTAWATIALAVLTLILVGVSFWVGRRQISDSRAVANLQVTLHLLREYDSEAMQATREALAPQLLGSGVQPQYAEGLLDFLETVGHLAHQGLVNKALLWNELSFPVLCYWGALEPYVRQRRADYDDDSIYEEAQWLYESMLQRERQRRHDPAYSVPQTAQAAFFRSETTVVVPPLG